MCAKATGIAPTRLCRNMRTTRHTRRCTRTCIASKATSPMQASGIAVLARRRLTPHSKKNGSRWSRTSSRRPLHEQVRYPHRTRNAAGARDAAGPARVRAALHRAHVHAAIHGWTGLARCAHRALSAAGARSGIPGLPLRADDFRRHQGLLAPGRPSQSVSRGEECRALQPLRRASGHARGRHRPTCSGHFRTGKARTGLGAETGRRGALQSAR